MQIINEPKLDFKDVLIMPKVSSLSSRADVSLRRQFKYIAMNGDECVIDCVPIIASNMDGVGTFSMAKSLADFGCLTALTKENSTVEAEEWIINNPGKAKTLIFSIGMPAYSKRAEAIKYVSDLMSNIPEVKMLCIDVANGYTTDFTEWISIVRENVPADTFIIAGNVVTPAQTEALILAGANAVKVGIGPGSVCTTRKVTGVGYPQLSAIIECADAAHGLKGFVVADGGCQVPGDVCKAFGAGADFVMLGGMLAGHTESEMEVVNEKITFYGSSSKTAQTKNGEELKDYRSSEGKAVSITHRGWVAPTIKHILGGVRSCCTYVGASSLKELSKRTTFVRVYNGAQYNTVFGDSSNVS
jgi:GMP reductase